MHFFAPMYLFWAAAVKPTRSARIRTPLTKRMWRMVKLLCLRVVLGFVCCDVTGFSAFDAPDVQIQCQGESRNDERRYAETDAAEIVLVDRGPCFGRHGRRPLHSPGGHLAEPLHLEGVNRCPRLEARLPDVSQL